MAEGTWRTVAQGVSSATLLLLWDWEEGTLGGESQFLHVLFGPAPSERAESWRAVMTTTTETLSGVSDFAGLTPNPCMALTLHQALFWGLYIWCLFTPRDKIMRQEWLFFSPLCQSWNWGREWLCDLTGHSAGRTSGTRGQTHNCCADPISSMEEDCELNAKW